MNIREIINRKTEELGNKLMPNLLKPLGLHIKNQEYGLGNLLTTRINFRRMGAVCGAALPEVGIYYLGHADLPHGWVEGVIQLMIWNTVGLPLTGTLCGVTGMVGYAMGQMIDKELNDKYRRFKKKIERNINSVSTKYSCKKSST